MGDHVLISPPFNITSEEIDKIVGLLTQVIDDVFQAADFPKVKASGWVMKLVRTKF